MIVKLSKKKTHTIYRLADRTIVPGASTISKMGEDQSFLTAWAHRLGLEQIDYKAETAEAGAIGSVAHHLVTCMFKGDSADFSEFSPVEVNKGTELFKRFERSWAEHELEFVANELPMVSEVHRYGGTLDVMARNKREELGLIDVKSSPRIYGHFYRQIAGYEVLWNENNDEKIIWKKIFRLDKKDPNADEVRWLPKNMDKHFDVFLAQLELYRAFKRLND